MVLGLGPADGSLNWNEVIELGPKEVGFEESFHMAATADRVPSLYIRNGRVVNLDPADPIEVNTNEPVGIETGWISPFVAVQMSSMRRRLLMA